MRLPRPELGLVVRYGFVWAAATRRPPPDAGKARPCLIVDLEEVREPALGGRAVTRVTYLPISHVAPREGEQALPIPPRVARHLGLTEEASFLYTSYAVEDDWPFDVEPVPGEDAAAHGLVPPRLFQMVAEDFARHLAVRPGLVHRRDG